MAADFEALRSSGDGADIELYIADRTFPAHRTVLGARSPFFKAMFASSMRDADSSGVKIVDVDPDVFEQLLKCAASCLPVASRC